MAVINRTECLVNKKSIRHQNIQGIILVVAVILTLNVVLGNPTRKTCEQAKREVAKIGFPLKWTSDTPSVGQICGEDSCCSSNLEQEMLRESKHQIDTFLRDAVMKLSSLLENRAKKFDGHFRGMMNKSKHDFHDMFQRTYGKIYLQNSDVFSDFFKELETYYNKGTVRLSETLEQFFGILYQRMFKVINSQYTFDDKYLECVSDHMIEMKPFGDVPFKLTVQLRRSFVGTRTYYKALAAAADAVKKMANVRVDDGCEKELTKMHSCGACKGQRGLGACASFCTTVLEHCLKNHMAIREEWDNFVDALDKVADRLVGPYNIESVVEPLNIKISEAVMIFQESGTEVSKKIYSLCGKPSLNRRKRDANIQDDDDDRKFEIKHPPMKLHGNKKKNKKFEDEDNNASMLEKLIKEIKLKVRETRQFWFHLPYQFCNNASIVAPLSSNGNCWNGTAIGDYTAPDSPSAQKPKPHALVSEQIFTLQVFLDKLRKAYHGDEVEIIDDSEDAVLDGSGSGSGDFEIEEPEIIPEVNVPPETDGPHEDLDNDISEETPSPPVTRTPEITSTYSGGAGAVSLNKALAQYLLPIVLVWFGGAISDLL